MLYHFSGSHVWNPKDFLTDCSHEKWRRKADGGASEDSVFANGAFVYTSSFCLLRVYSVIYSADHNWVLGEDHFISILVIHIMHSALQTKLNNMSAQLYQPKRVSNKSTICIINVSLVYHLAGSKGEK